MVNLKIKVLIPALFGGVVALGLVQGGMALKSLSDLETKSNEMGRHMTGSANISALDNSFGDLRRHYVALLSAADNAEIERLLPQIADAKSVRDNAMQAFSQRITLPATRARYNTMAEDFRRHDELSQQMIDRAFAGERLSLKPFMVENMDPISARSNEIVMGISANNLKLAEASIAQTAEVAGSAKLAMIIAVLLTALLAIGAAIMSIFRVTRPISDITASMNTLAAGNINAEIPHAQRTDEIGEMAAAVAVFRDNAQERARLDRKRKPIAR